MTNKHSDAALMKMISALFVVFIHAVGILSANGVSFGGNVVNILSRFSVPVFIMISGRYMLIKSDMLYSLKKAFNLFSIMILTSLVYLSYDVLFENFIVTDITAVIKYLLTEPIHLWYIYTTIALYLITPVISVFCRNASKKEFEYAILFCLISGMIMYISTHINQESLLAIIANKSKLPYSLSFLGCYILGYYLSKHKLSITLEIFIYALGAAGIALSLLLLHYSEAAFQLSISFFAPNVIIQSIGFFIALQKICSTGFFVKEAVISFSYRISTYTLGIYLYHILILKLITKYFTFTCSVQCIITLSVIAYFICALLSAAFKYIKNPVLKTRE